MSQPKAPYIEPALVDWLQRLFPNKCPSDTDTGRQIWQAVGAQRVIAYLRATCAEQQSDALAERLTAGE